ncbi:MAG TPA: chemotaxis protein CheW [Humisphaera sp.]|jgi:two-component system chemotaxis sensor kinase CheA|nr:chemotaxis protein CheW [Humisphaera sp.]
MANESGDNDRFIVEAREHLGAMSAAMIALERNEGNAPSQIEQLLRAAHSIKGGAGFIGRRNIERLAHAFEEVVENIRDGRVARNAEVVDALLAVLDRITALVDDASHSDEADISEPLARLTPLAGVATALATTTSAHDFEITERLRQAWPAENAFLYGVKLDWSECEQRLGLSPLAVAEQIERAGHLLDSRTQISGAELAGGLPRPPFWWLGIVSSSAAIDDFIKALNIPCAMVVQLGQKSAPVETKPPAPADAPRAASPASLRVSVSLVDRMMALAGELVLVRNQAMRQAGPVNSPQRRLLRRLDSITDELQDAALRMRAQPVGALFDRFPRVVRDLARQLGKQIDVRISGSEVELDKTIVELLADPLTHLIRNCCDHGIEMPEQRVAAGKTPGGTINLSARQERGQMVIEIRDDGRGIDIQAVKRKAIEQGVKRADELEHMGDRQIFALILLSGFSTAKQVTDLSGRGVGMDVVKTNLDQIGGVVEIDSQPQRGSIFTLRLPLTLAIMPCLLLGSDGQCYGVPQRDVEELVLLGDAHARRRIERNHEGEVLRWRGRLLPVIRVREALARREPFDAAALAEVAGRYHAEGASASQGYAAIIRLGSRRFAMAFDEVLGSENIVVKPLHPLLRPLGIYAATTILGDGSVALIFSGEGIARHSGILNRAIAETAPAVPTGSEAQPEAVLLFRCGRDELLAVRMNSVRRVVAITTDRIEQIGGREMVNVDGAATNVVRLDRLLKLSPYPDAARLFLLLPRNAGMPIGLLVCEIVDTPKLQLQIESRAYKAEGVLGTMMIRGEIALFIDLDQIARMWEKNAGSLPKALAHRRGARILVVDDTQFFQKLVAEHLRQDGYEVTVADNGSAALAMLREQTFDIVVSDIEMPVMDGHAFAQAVRADPALAHIPLVALTTLNTPASRATAAESGFDAYEVKLDRQTLLETVAMLLAQSRRQTDAAGTEQHA